MKVWLLLALAVTGTASAELTVLPDPVHTGGEMTFSIVLPADRNASALLRVGDGREQAIPAGIESVDMTFEAPEPGAYEAILAYAAGGISHEERVGYIVLEELEEKAPFPGVELLLISLFATIVQRRYT